MGGGSQFILQVRIAHRINVATARSRLRQLVNFSISGGDVDGSSDSGKRAIAHHLDLASQRQHTGIAHAGIGELIEPGLAGHQCGRDRVLHADLRLASR